MRTASSYETAFANYLGPDVEAFAFWKGRVALYAILVAMGIGEGDEVILSGYTCVVVPNAIRCAGATPVYVDIRPGEYNVDVETARQAITEKTKAIIVQHSYGIPADTAAFVALGKEKGIAIIEDCAHAFGSTRDGVHVGLLADASFFSSQWTKPYTTGLGGMAITRDKELAAKLAAVQAEFERPSPKRLSRLKVQYALYQRFFSPRLYWFARRMLNALSGAGLFVGSVGQDEMEGKIPDDFRWRMSEFQEKVGTKKLAEAIAGLPYRRELAAIYDRKLAEAGWPTCGLADGTVLLRYPVCVANKDALLEAAKSKQIELGSWFETPLHPLPLEQHHYFGYELGRCPVTEATAREAVNLPVHGRVSKADADRILEFFLQNAQRLAKA